MKQIRHYNDGDELFTLFERESDNPGECNAPAYLFFQRRVINGNNCETITKAHFDELREAVTFMLMRIVGYERGQFGDDEVPVSKLLTDMHDAYCVNRYQPKFDPCVDAL